MKKEALTDKVQIMIEPSLIRRIDDWRFENRVSSRSSAMRKLLEAALDQLSRNSPQTKTATE